MEKNSGRYPMCKDQPAQIDCRLAGCKFHSNGQCNNVSPAITLNPNGRFTCWSREEFEVVSQCGPIKDTRQAFVGKDDEIYVSKEDYGKFILGVRQEQQGDNNIPEETELQKMRMKIWCDAWASVAGAFTCKEPEAATRWADAAVKEFDERFK